MIDETFLRLQPSEAVVCSAASRLMAAFIASGQVNPENEEAFLERSLSLAIRLAQGADRAIDSDDESGERL